MKKREVADILSSAAEMHRQGRLADAAQKCRKVLSQQPNHPDALHLLGMVACHQGDLSTAVRLLRRAVSQDPSAPVFRLNLGNVLRDSGQSDEAMQEYREALRLSPDSAVAHYNLANELQKRKDFVDAILHYGRALECNAEFPEAYYHLAKIFEKLGKTDDAISSYLSAIRVQRDYTDAWYDLGTIFQNLRKYDEAIRCYEQVLSLEGPHLRAYYNLGSICAEKKDYEKAAVYYRTALKSDPSFAEALAGLCSVLRETGDIAGSIEAGEAARRMKPEMPDVHSNLAIAYTCDGRLDDAVFSAERAIALKPDLHEAHHTMAMAFFMRGDFASAWRKYEWRSPRSVLQQRIIPVPDWDGSSLEGMTLLISGEQGIGDQIMFASVVGDAIRAAGKCVIECDRRLIPLFARSFPGAEMIPAMQTEEDVRKAERERIDWGVMIGSLPFFFRNDAASFGEGRSYLLPDPDLKSSWQRRFRQLGEGMKIGIAWRGGEGSLPRFGGSTSLKQWIGLLSVRGCHFINLQCGNSSQELHDLREEFGIVVHHWEEADTLNDLDGFTAKIAALDLVISADNSTVHLAGALGVPTWVLLPKAADWRWMTKCDDSVWYSSLRLFRQKDHGDWGPVFEEVTTSLEMALQNKVMLSKVMQSSPSVKFRKCPLPMGRWAALLNDTTYWYHWGCTGTSTAIVEELQARGYRVDRIPIQASYRCEHAPTSLDDFGSKEFYDAFARANDSVIRQIRQSDIVVLNGEGSLHGLPEYARNLLYLAYAAKHHLGKEVHIINHSCYPEDSLNISDSPAWAAYRLVYRGADSIAVREPASFRLMHDAGIAAVQAFDCLPLFVKRHYGKGPERSGKHLLIGGSVAWRDDSLAALARYVQEMRRRGFTVSLLFGANLMPASDDILFVDAFRKICPDGWRLIKAATIYEWLDSIAGAALLVSGRFHHTIAAWCLGTPFLLLDSNTPKNSGLAEILGVSLPLPHGLPDLSERLLMDTGSILKGPFDDNRGQKVEDLCALAAQNFAGIRRGDIHE